MNRYWITDPVGHRAEWNLRYARPDPAPGEFVLTAAPDEWVCDRCNASIDHNEPVPCEESYALCWSCAGLRDDSTVSDWSVRQCGCEPCSARLAVMTQLWREAN